MLAARLDPILMELEKFANRALRGAWRHHDLDPSAGEYAHAEATRAAAVPYGGHRRGVARVEQGNLCGGNVAHGRRLPSYQPIG